MDGAALMAMTARHVTVAELVDDHRSRRDILACFDMDQERSAAAAILDGLELIGLVEPREGVIEWAGPEPPELLRRLVALRDGPARALIGLPKEEDCPLTVYAVPDGGDGLSPYLRAWGGAAGTGFSRRAAAASCLFEVAERCSQMRAGDESVRTAALADLGDDAVPPDRLLLNEPADPAVTPLDARTPISWAVAHHVGTGETRWLPAEYCYRSAVRDRSVWTCPADSSGCASGVSTDDVVVRGFLELVERDAVAIWWFNRLRRPSVPAEMGDLDAVRAIAAWQHRRGRRLHHLDLTSDLGIPVVAAVSCDVTGRGIAVGFGAHFDPAVAAIKASLEMIQFQAMIELSLRFRGLVPGEPSESTKAALGWFEDVAIGDEAYLLADADAVPAPQWADSPSPSERLARCLAVAAHHDLDVFHLDLTRSWIGIPVGRVFIPGLRSLEKRFGPGRLFDVPVAMGWLSSQRATSDLNPRRMVF